MEDTFVSGVGDEVVLFFLFIIISFVIIALFTLRAKPRERRPAATGHGGDALDQGHTDTHVPQEDTATASDGVRNRGQPDSVVVRLIESNSIKTVTLPRNTTVDAIIRSNYGDEIGRGKVVKLIYLGRIIPEDTLLRDVTDHDATSIPLHVHIQDRQAGHHGDEAGEVDLAAYMIPLFLLIFAIVWAAFLIWPAIFSLTSKLMLFFLSTAFITLVYATH